MTEIIKTDVCVIGAGAGGLAVAAAAALSGASVVLVEKGKLGGSGGDVASKALLAAARRAEAPRRAAPFGVMAQRPAIDFAKVQAHIQGVIAAIAPMSSRERFAGLGVRVIAGAARFKDARTVAVGDEIEIAAQRFVVATGSVPAVPPIAGLPATPHLTTETIFDLTQCPDHLIVLGAGPTGMELAQAFRRLGAEVTVLDTGRPLAADDQECVDIVLDQFAREGVTVRSGAEILRVEPAGPKLRLIVKGTTGEETVDGSHLLVATGRTPNVDGLNLAAARVRLEGGAIGVDKDLRTSNRRVYAIGDVTGAPPYTHFATHQARLVIRRALLSLRAEVNRDAVPRVTFTDPELAQVGLTEGEARKRHGQIRILRSAYRDNDRAQAERDVRGHIKVIAAPNGRILGATIVGAQADELITTWTLAVQQQLTVQAFADLILPYPTLAEIGQRAALSFEAPGLTKPKVRRIIAFLRRFG